MNGEFKESIRYFEIGKKKDDMSEKRTKEFYYMPHASIHKERDKYGLSGMGNTWKHDTMDSTTASAMKVRMFKEVKDSLFIDPDTSLWYLAYLYDQGFSMSQIKSMQQVINEMMLNEINGDFRDKAPEMLKLQSIMSAVSPDPVRRIRPPVSATAAAPVAPAAAARRSLPLLLR